MTHDNCLECGFNHDTHKSDAIEWHVIDECKQVGDHLVDCDSDGYCNACGYQCSPDDFDNQEDFLFI